MTWKPAESAVLQPRCACIEDPEVVRKILNHLEEKSSLDSGVQIANPGAPPQASLFGMQNVLNGASMAVSVMEKAL